MQTLLIEKTRAKKQHKCDFCGLIIEIGEVYERQKNVSEGTLYTWKSHLSCNKIAAKLEMFDNCDEGVTGEDFKEYIREEYQNIMQSKFNDIYESKEFHFPIFADQLNFVKTQHVC